MAWNAGQLYQFTLFLCHKHQTGTITPDDFFYAWNSEQRTRMGELLGRLGPAVKNMPRGMIEDAAVSQSLSPFVVQATLTIDSSGQATMPTNMIQALALRISDRKVTYINKGQIYSVVNSDIDAPSVANHLYYYTEYDTYYKFWPASSASATLDYIKDCDDIVYAYTPDANGLPVYDAGNSTQAEWGSIDLELITKRTLKMFGIHFSSQEFAGYGQSIINNGS